MKKHYDHFVFHGLNQIMERLGEAKLDTQENLNLLIPHFESLTIVLCTIARLTEANPSLLTQTHLSSLLTKSSSTIKFIGESLYFLCFTEDGLNTAANLNALLAQSNYALGMREMIMHMWGEKILDQPTFILIFQHAKFMHDIAQVFDHLRLINTQFITTENFNTLVRYREFCTDILVLLQENRITNQAGFDAIIQRMNTYTAEKALAFEMGPLPGSKTSVTGFFSSPISDPINMTKEIFDFMPKRERKL